MALLYKSEPGRGAVWARMFAERLPALPFRVWPEVGAPEDIRFIAAWVPPEDLSAFPNLEVLFSVAAGVDQFDLSAVPATLPVVRMIEPGLVAGMADYVTMAVLAVHRGLPMYLRQQREGVWRADPVRPASAARVGVMGLGVLGRAVLERLGTLGVVRSGWSRSAQALEGVRCHAGSAGLGAFLAACDILVCLLPLTAETRGMLNASLFAGLPRGAALINVGRGPHVVDADLLAALDSGQLGAAVLDVTEPEPLPPGHAFWSHPGIWLTPHVASSTQAESGGEALIANLERYFRGEAMHGVVDRARGY